MQPNDIDKLTELRQSIIENIVPLLDNENLEPAERFRLLSRLAQAQGKVDLYQKAFEVAKSLSKEDRLQSYMTLLDDVDYEIDSGSSTVSQTDESAVQPPVESAATPMQTLTNEVDGQEEQQPSQFNQ